MKPKTKPETKSANRRRTVLFSSARSHSRRRRKDIQLKTLNQLVQVLSHETRNILGSFATCLELLRRSAQLDTEDRELVSILQSGARRLNEISEQFAAFDTHMSLRLEPVDISAIIQTIVERLRRDERCSAAVDIQIECDPAVGRLAADRNALNKVFWNLFLNAAQAMGERGTLRIETKRLANRLEVHVRDSGPGIPASIRSKIFEPLFTTKTRATGLGLAIARKIVEEHGGKIRLSAELGKGSFFKVAFPLTARQAVAGSRRVTR